MTVALFDAKPSTAFNPQANATQARTMEHYRRLGLVGNPAVEQGKQVAMFLTKEAVRLALKGDSHAVACDGCPPVSRLSEQYTTGGGELLVCPVCFNARKLPESELGNGARLAGATPLWEWIEEGATVFSY